MRSLYPCIIHSLTKWCSTFLKFALFTIINSLETYFFESKLSNCYSIISTFSFFSSRFLFIFANNNTTNCLWWKYSSLFYQRILTFRITSTVCLFHKMHGVPSFRACNLTYQRRVYRFLCKFYWYPIAVDDSARNVYVVLVIVVGNRANHMSNDHRPYWTLPIERLFWLVEFFRLEHELERA